MINEILLAKELSNYKKHLIEDDDPRLELLKQELLVENIFEIEVDNKISITNAEIMESIINSRKKVKISYLFSPYYDRLIECKDSLMEGYDFHNLSKIINFNEDIIIEKTPYMEEAEIDDPFKNIIFKLSPENFSEIIKTDRGYYIIKIDDIITRSLSEMEIQNSRSTHTKIIRNKKSQQLAKDFVDSFMSPRNISVKSGSFNSLVKNLFKIYRKFGSIPLGILSSEESSFNNNWIGDTLIFHKDGIIKTKQLLNYIQIRPIHFDTRDIKSFSKDLEKKLAVIIRDYFLVLEGNDTYDIDNQKINNQVRLWKRKLIVDDYFHHLSTSSIKIIRKNKNNINFKIDSLYNINNDNQNYNKLNFKLDSLKSEINISVNLELLSEIDVADDVKGHFPELKLFKLGLPYLKEAYPAPNIIFSLIK